jgi:polysaccharide pyruvyl transferase WcaK-like protein
MGVGKDKSIVYNNYRELVKYILQNTKYKIAFIPHVVINGNNDLDAMKPLYEEFKESKRVFLVSEKLSAAQYKGFISKCCLFVGARTHATIAAYSTCVPTLVVGYSVKARGIARDIFGSEENMVISAQALIDENELLRAFKYLQENEKKIRAHLQKTIPAYIEKAWLAGEELKKLLKANSKG